MNAQTHNHMCKHYKLKESIYLSKRPATVDFDAHEGPFASVQPPVVVQICDLCERFSAFATNEWSLVSMDSLVIPKVCRLGKTLTRNTNGYLQFLINTSLSLTFLTKRTNKLPVNGMVTHVREQLRFACKSLGAKAARGRFAEKDLIL